MQTQNLTCVLDSGRSNRDSAVPKLLFVVGERVITRRTLYQLRLLREVVLNAGVALVCLKPAQDLTVRHRVWTMSTVIFLCIAKQQLTL
jgi:hypothetical protein